MAVDRADASDEDATRQVVERRTHPDRPGTEPPGLSRGDSRAGAEAANEQPGSPVKEETPRSGWDATGVAEDPGQPEVEGIHLTDDRRCHILDGEPGGRGVIANPGRRTDG